MPTFDRDEAVNKTGYLHAMRSEALYRDWRTYLVLNAAIGQEFERWTPGSFYDRGLETVH